MTEQQKISREARLGFENAELSEKVKDYNWLKDQKCHICNQPLNPILVAMEDGRYAYMTNETSFRRKKHLVCRKCHKWLSGIQDFIYLLVLLLRGKNL